MIRRLCLNILLSCCAGQVMAADPEKSVADYQLRARPQLGRAMALSRVASGLGSGFVIEGNRIMTNAHVVSWSSN